MSMNDDLRQPIDQPLYPQVKREIRPPGAAASAFPAGAFTASVLFDVLALLGEGPELARVYEQRAIDLLKVGLGASLAALALEVLDSLKVPPATPAGNVATRQMALDGAVVAVYLLNLAARQKHIVDNPAQPDKIEFGAVGFSLAGLALLGMSGKLA